MHLQAPQMPSLSCFTAPSGESTSRGLAVIDHDGHASACTQLAESGPWETKEEQMFTLSYRQSARGFSGQGRIPHTSYGGVIPARGGFYSCRQYAKTISSARTVMSSMDTRLYIVDHCRSLSHPSDHVIHHHDTCASMRSTSRFFSILHSHLI